MRAIVLDQPGGPDTLELREVDAPSPGPGELCVQTSAIGLNFIDTHQRSGVYPVEYPFTPGFEASGTVLAVGSGVEGFTPGDRVTTCAGRAAYAEQFVVDAMSTVRVPEGVDDRVAAAIPLQGATAHYLATSASRPESGETVLVHAGAGGVGLLLTQLLTSRGVRVISTASTEEKRELSRGAGAVEALGYDGWADRARELTDGEGVAVVYDSVGLATFDDSLRALRVRGDMVLFGRASGAVEPFDLERLNAGGSPSIRRAALVHYMRTRDEVAWCYRELFELLEAGALSVRIGAEFALSDAGAAHRALEGRETTGKVLLLP